MLDMEHFVKIADINISNKMSYSIATSLCHMQSEDPPSLDKI